MSWAQQAAEDADPGPVVRYWNGRISSVNPDGTVSVDHPSGETIPNLKVSAGYARRAVGDQVMVHDHDGLQVVQPAAGAEVALPEPDLWELRGTAPAAAEGFRKVDVYLRVRTDGSAHVVGVPVDAPPPPATTGDVTKTATGCATYRDGRQFRVGLAEQGSYGGYGPDTGVWTFGPGAWAGLAGKTPTRVRVWVTRNPKGHGHTYGPVPVHLHLHAVEELTGAAPALIGAHTISPGARLGQRIEGIDLPVEWGALLRDGTAAGLAVFGPAGDNAEFLPDLVLRVDF